MIKDKDAFLLRKLKELRDDHKGKNKTGFKDMKKTSIYLTQENAKRLKLLRVTEGRKSSDIYNDAVALYFEYYKKMNEGTEAFQALVNNEMDEL